MPSKAGLLRSGSARQLYVSCLSIDEIVTLLNSVRREVINSQRRGNVEKREMWLACLEDLQRELDSRQLTIPGA